MKIIDILNEKVNGTLVDGFEFFYEGSQYAYFKKVNEIQSIVSGTNIGAIYELDKILSDEIETIEENKEIKELNKISYNEFKYTDTKHRFDLTNIEYDKINELVREVNKIKKQLEEQETEDIDTVERELNKMF